MVELLHGAALVAATVTAGLTAGFFYAFSHGIMPALGRADDRGFVGRFQELDRSVVNPWFLAGYLGAPALTVLAAVLQLGGDGRSILPWTATALVLHVATLVITAVVHLPLNAEIQAAGTPGEIADPAAVRNRFERRWVRWNVVRTGTSIAAFGLLAWALVLYGRLQT